MFIKTQAEKAELEKDLKQASEEIKDLNKQVKVLVHPEQLENTDTPFPNTAAAYRYYLFMS